MKGFEKTANFFVLRRYPRIIYLALKEMFCTRIGGEVFNGELHGNEVVYVKKWIGGREPKSLQEVLERLSEYALNADAWIIFKHGGFYAVAYLAYPSP
jgi:hypothetical protein